MKSPPTRDRKARFAQANDMILGETTLLIAVLLILSGAAKGITRRLRVNDYIASFFLLVILLLSIRGNIKLAKGFTLSLGSVLSLIVGSINLATNIKGGKALPKVVFSTLASSAIVFIYSLHFSENVTLDPRLLILLLSLLVGVWCALSSGSVLPCCLFSALWGSFVGSTLFLVFFLKSGNIGGNYTFSLMWIAAISGLIIRLLLDRLFAQTKSPRSYVYYEADGMEENQNKEKL